MDDFEIVLPGSLHEGYPTKYPPPPSLEEIAAIAEGNVLGAYVVDPAGGFRLAMMEVQPREQWPDGMFKCILMSNLTAIGVELDAPINLTPDVIAEIHADAFVAAGTLIGRQGATIDGEPLV